MAGFWRTKASLRFFGDDLDPLELTTLLGAGPTKSSLKGDVLKSGHVLKRGSWLLHAEEANPGDLDGQIAEICSSLTNDLNVWKDLSARYGGDIFCGLFMKQGNEGCTLTSATLAMLGERGLELNLDVYDPEPNVDSPN